VIRQIGIGEDWLAVVDSSIPPALMGLLTATLEAYGRADLDALLTGAAPDLVIVQPPELPASRSYTGRDGLIEALLDWPRQWADFRMEPRRIFGVDDEHVVFVTLHRGRPHSVDIEVEAEFVFLIRWQDGLVTRWDMFMTEEEALRRAAERRADGGDDDAAERDGRERAQEAGPEEARADHGQRQ
jgi:ketosteroid isomerase-like protein